MIEKDNTTLLRPMNWVKYDEVSYVEEAADNFELVDWTPPTTFLIPFTSGEWRNHAYASASTSSSTLELITMFTIGFTNAEDKYRIPNSYTLDLPKVTSISTEEITVTLEVTYENGTALSPTDYE